MGTRRIALNLKSRIDDGDPLGLLLPPGAAAAIGSLAASYGGRPLVPLNPTAGAAALADAITRSGLKAVLTSNKLLEKVEVTFPDGIQVLDFEELMGKKPGLGDALATYFSSQRGLERAAGADAAIAPDREAAIVFTSGSSGSPKGVPLTHAMLGANIEQVARVLPIDEDDCVLGVLPLFHAFGLVIFWLGLRTGLKIAATPNPLDAGTVGKVIDEQGVSIALATPTFLALWMRRCAPSQLGRLKLVIAGAERLRPEFASAFEERFGLRPIEGYGATECSPVIAISTPHHRGASVFQPGNRPGRVGRPLAGIEVRAVDPESGEERAAGESGHLLVRGPNIMGGYLNDAERSAEALDGPWYRTGDIGRIDEEGFIQIVDRLARFSKIGGEMVPHGRVEDALQSVVGGDDRCFALSAVPDDKKGERLILFHTLNEEDLGRALEGARAQGLPNLFLPRSEDCHHLEALPMLPSGKLDMATLKKRAAAI